MNENKMQSFSAFSINSDEPLQNSFGDHPPLHTGNGKRPPDRRRVSMRWLTGSVLTGVTSVLLMGGALYAAVEGRQKMAQPASALADNVISDGESFAAVQKGDRPTTIVALPPLNEHIMQVPTVSRVGNSNIIRKRPFAYASAPLAILPRKKVKYPPFNPLTVFRASRSDKANISSDVIYGADVESEVRIEVVPFSLNQVDLDPTIKITPAEVEHQIRTARQSLSDGELQVGALPYLDTTRFALKQEEIAPPTGLDIKIIAENVSTAQPSDSENLKKIFEEEVIKTLPQHSLEQALSSLNLSSAPLKDMVIAMAGELGTGPLDRGTRLRVAWEQLDDEQKTKICRRISVYRGGQHLKSIALNDKGTIVWANQPAPMPAVMDEDKTNKEPAITTASRSNLPNIYDGLYRAALSQGLNTLQARQVVRTVAFDVDFKSRVKSTDALEVFYSLEEGKENASDASEILYIGLTLNGKKRPYYRFKAKNDKTVDYYDENGRSSKKFLLRKPVPNARFGSKFGRRRHPISRTYKMHFGVDFSAPRGTPILAAGNGVVEKAGWNAGYGRQTIIRHANGYKTSYNHQHRFAKGIRPGARVVQGQIIGQVGSSGYSTGPHLHYEVIVNGNKVNPMKIRLPNGRSLKGRELAQFKQERDRINALLTKARQTNQNFAALN